MADITGAAAGGGGILLSGHIATTTVQGHGAGSQTVVTRTPAVWLSTDGGVTWTLAPVPVSHGATNGLAGIAADATGFVAVRPGSVSAGPNAQPDGVVYASANGTSWRYVSTLTSGYGVQIGMVAGRPGRFRGPGPGTGRVHGRLPQRGRPVVAFRHLVRPGSGQRHRGHGDRGRNGPRDRGQRCRRKPAAVPGPGAARSVRARRERRCCARRDRFPAQRQRHRRLPQPAGRRGRGRRPAGRLVGGRRFLVTRLLVVLLGQRCRHPLRFRPRPLLIRRRRARQRPACPPPARRRPACPLPVVDVRCPCWLRLTRGGSVQLTLARRVWGWFTSPAASGPGSPSSGASASAAASVPSVPPHRRPLRPSLRHLRQPGRQRRRRRPAADQRGARPGGLAGDR